MTKRVTGDSRAVNLRSINGLPNAGDGLRVGGRRDRQTKYRRRAIQQSTCRTTTCQDSGAPSSNDGFGALMLDPEYDATDLLLQPGDGVWPIRNTMDDHCIRNCRFGVVAGYEPAP